jgi:transcriptional regulator with XRE-family HTH domain
MKSGNKKPLHSLSGSFDVHLKDYRESHSTKDCHGEFKLRVEKDLLIPFDALGPTPIPYVILVTCDQCGAAFIPEGYQEFLNKRLATMLILHKGLLTKAQIRFLRIASELTQDEVARGIGATDKSHYLKFESKNYESTMTENMQVRLKLFYAKHYGINNAEELWAINDLRSDMTVSIEPKEILQEEQKKELENVILMEDRKGEQTPDSSQPKGKVRKIQ